MTVLDALPTLLSAANLPAATDIDGRDQWPALTSGVRLPATGYHVTGLDGEAIVQFPWKLVARDPDTPELYRLDEDPREQRNLATEHPDRLQELLQAMAATPQG